MRLTSIWTLRLPSARRSRRFLARCMSRLAGRASCVREPSTTRLAVGSACNAETTRFCKISLQALSTRALLRLKVVHWPISLNVGGGGGGGGLFTVTRVEPLAEQPPASEVAVTVMSIVEPGAAPVVSSTAAMPLPLRVPAVTLHSYRTAPKLRPPFTPGVERLIFSPASAESGTAVTLRFGPKHTVIGGHASTRIVLESEATPPRPSLTSTVTV